MAEAWLADVRKYSPNADESVVAAIAQYCGTSPQSEDTSTLSLHDSVEVGRVRENFLKKRLGLTQDDSTLDASILAVADRIKGPTAERVTVYYLLAERFGKLDKFGTTPKAVPLAGTTTASAPPASAAPPPRREPQGTAQPVHKHHEKKPDKGGMGRWLPWILLALLAIVLIYALRTCSADRTSETAATMPAPTTVPTTVPTTSAPAAVVIPTGAGVIGSLRDDLPMLTVYFDVAKSDVDDEFAVLANDVKTYLDGHPDATLVIFGYNDPTGDAATNAALAKSRAENVKAALERLGVSAERILLEKPANTTGTGSTNAESRRVEVIVREQ